MTLTVAVVAGTVLALGAAAVFAVRWIRNLRSGALADAARRLGRDRIRLVDPSANSLGVESAGLAQVRGNGYLALTDRELLFVMWAPRREYLIPLPRITGVSVARSHLGKSRMRDLLRVEFLDDTGEPDAVGLLVADLEAWLEALRTRV